MNLLDDEELEPPERSDFRRVGKGTPFVVSPAGKRVRYGRPSNAGKILDDESALTDWKLRTTVVGAAQRPDLMAIVSTLDPASSKKEIRDIAEECLVAGKGKERTVKGTAVHSMFDHIDRGDDWEPAPQWVDLCLSYTQTLAAWGLLASPAEIEVHCINDEFRLAGSMDRRYQTTKVLVAPDGTTIPIGSMLAGDTKTGATLEYASGSYATQLAAYADSQRYDVLTDEREPFNPPTFPDWGIIIHADSGSTNVQIFWVDLNAGREGLKLSREVKAWRTRQDLLTLAPGPVQLAPSSPPAAPVVPQDAPRLASYTLHTRDRVKAAVAHSDLAAKSMQRHWPMGVPGLKHDGHTWEQLDEINDAVEKVESEFSMPFFPRWVDPEAVERHPSNRWATPDGTKPTVEQVTTLQDELDAHPRKPLIRAWIDQGRQGGFQQDDNYALAHALFEFAHIDDVDENVTLLLEGTLRALGYTRGLLDLGKVKAEDAPNIMGAAFSIVAGTAVLLYGEDDKPILRTNIVKG